MKFHPLALVLSFCIGMVFVICHTPRPKLVVKFPSPGVPSALYSNSDGSCYKIKSEEVACPADRKHVLPQPVTDSDKSDSLLKLFHA